MSLRITGTKFPFFSDEETFNVDSSFNKQNDRVAMIGNDVSEHRRVSRTKHPSSIMMLGVVASNVEKMPPVWFERDWLTSTVCRET